MRTEQEIGFGFWEVQDGEHLTREIRDVAAFRNAVGDQLVVGFAQLFTAVGRLDSLLHLMGMNSVRSEPVVAGQPDSAHDPESVAASRNRMLIGTFIWGVFHELNASIETLQGGGITKILCSGGRDSVALASWKQLRRTGHRWRTALAKTARNQFAFHLGDAQTMLAGLQAWPVGSPLTVSTSDGSARMNAHFHIGFDLLAKGLAFTDEDMTRLTEQGVADRNIAIDAMRVFFGVLHAKGASILSPTEVERLRSPGAPETSSR